VLHDGELKKLTHLIERHIQWHQLIHGEISKSAVDQNIA
jgi:hypothetical protein